MYARRQRYPVLYRTFGRVIRRPSWPFPRLVQRDCFAEYEKTGLDGVRLVFRDE